MMKRVGKRVNLNMERHLGTHGVSGQMESLH